MRPSRLFLQLLLVWLLLGLIAALATVFEWPQAFGIKLVFWCWFGLVTLLALLDGLASRRPRLEVTRELDPHLALGVRQRVTLKIVNNEVSQQHTVDHRFAAGTTATGRSAGKTRTRARRLCARCATR